MLLFVFLRPVAISFILAIRRPGWRIAGIPITLSGPAPGLFYSEIFGVAIDEQIIRCAIVPIPGDLSLCLVKRAPCFRMDMVVLRPGRWRFANVYAVHRPLYIDNVVVLSLIVITVRIQKDVQSKTRPSRIFRLVVERNVPINELFRLVTRAAK